MHPDDLKRILDALTQADVSEFSLKTGSFDLSLRRGVQVMASQVPAAVPLTTAPSVFHTAPLSTASLSTAPLSATNAVTPLSSVPTEIPEVSTTDEAEKVAPAAPAPVKGNPLKAPIVGTFYAASSPDAEPYVKVGDRVEAGQVLCIIEAMKLMNEIEAEQAGIVREITVKNGDPVEYGQVLFIIE